MMKTDKENMEERTGLRSLELLYRRLNDCQGQENVCFQSQLRINGADMGVLLPWQYLPVAERTDHCCQLAKWAVERACSCIAALNKREVEFDWLSVYVSPRLLDQQGFCEFVQDLIVCNQILPQALCIEIPYALLCSQKTQAFETILQLRKTGVKILVCGYGDEHCQVMQLVNADVDFVILDEQIVFWLSSDNPRQAAAASALLALVNGQEIEPIADGVHLRTQAELLAKHGCSKVAGDFAGGYMKQSGIRT